MDSNKIESNENEMININISDVEKTILNTNVTKIYPFINEMVDTFYNENCNNLIDKSIETNDDKSTFLMFVMMYFAIHLKLENEDDETKKMQIKMIMTDLIRDQDKRRYCIGMFENRFAELFKDSSKK